MIAGLLAQADRLLSGGTEGSPRGAALVTRNALEEWVRNQSARIEPGLSSATMASQLLCLELAVDRHVAGRARVAWHDLSEACHHHAYDLPPSVQQVARLLAEVRRLTSSEASVA